MDEMPVSPAKLNYPKVSVIGLGYFCINLSLCFYDPFIPVFINKYTDSKLLIGLITTIGFLLSALLQPYMGGLSDRIHTKLGRRRPFLLIGMPLSALFLLLVPFSRNFAGLFVCILGFNLMFSIYRVPAMSLMPDLTPERHWSSANGIINLLGGVGALVAYLVCAMLYDQDPHSPFYLIAAALFVSTALILLLIREPKQPPQREQEEKVGVAHAFKAILADRDKSALLLLLSIFFRFMGYNGFEIFITLYGVHRLGIKPGTAAVLLGIMAVSFIVFAVPSGIIASKLGRKRTVVIGLALMFVTFLVSAFVSSFVVIAAMGPLGGFGYALTNTNAYPMLIGMGGKKVGVYTGLYYFFYSLAAIAAPTLFGWFIDGMGYGSMFYASCVFLLLAVLSMSRVRGGEAVPTAPEEAPVPEETPAAR